MAIVNHNSISGVSTISATSSITVGDVKLNPHSVSIGTTDTTGRNAGVSTANGTLIFNTTTNQLEVYSPAGWIVGAAGPFNATGGTKDTTSRSGYVVHTFTSPGTFTVAGQPGNVEYLVIAGGGGSSQYIAGGGGAGGYRTSTSFPMTPGPYPVTVGGGGAGFSAPNRGATGTDSTFSTITSSGGGGGGGGEPPGGPGGGPGGSGGGGGRQRSPGMQVAGTGNSGGYSPSEGNNGGAGSSTGSTDNYGSGGGGGGAGGAGGAASGGTAGAGGNGQASSITGTSVTRAGGGGGGAYGGTQGAAGPVGGHC